MWLLNPDSWQLELTLSTDRHNWINTLHKSTLFIYATLKVVQGHLVTLEHIWAIKNCHFLQCNHCLFIDGATYKQKNRLISQVECINNYAFNNSIYRVSVRKAWQFIYKILYLSLNRDNRLMVLSNIFCLFEKKLIEWMEMLWAWPSWTYSIDFLQACKSLIWLNFTCAFLQMPHVIYFSHL